MRYLLVMTIMACAVAAAQASPFVLYVSTDGNDAWTGALDAPAASGDDGPLSTIDGARDRLRLLRSQGGIPADTPVRVLIRGGNYFIARPVVFLPEDSGIENAPVEYAAYPGETPVLHGGRQLTEWRVENGVWITDVPEVKSDRYAVGAFWVNGERRDPARFPKATNTAGDYPADSDFFYADGAIMEVSGENKEEVKSSTRFRYRDGDIQLWEHLEDAVFVVFHSWATSLHRLKSLDSEKREVEFTGAARWPFTRWKEDQWYFVEHLLDALQIPGEWCIDRETGTLHYIPMPGETPDSVTAVIPLTKHFLLLKGDPDNESFVSYLNFTGLSMQYGDWPIGAAGHSDGQAETSVEAAIMAVGARNCVFEDCEVAHVGTYGVWFRTGSQNNVLRRCTLTDLGAGGVRIGEPGDPATPAHVAGSNTVDNCILHDGGRIYRSAVGVWIGRSSDNTISHNEICDFRYSGISVGWSWGYAPSSANNNIIEYNHIHNLGKGQLSDMGGIYTLGISPGTVLRNNYIHDILSNGNISGGWGLYTDEGSTDILLTNNVVHNTRTGGFHQHYGKENKVVNNILAFSQRDQIIRSREEEHISFFFEKNIVYFKEGNLLGSTWKNNNFVMDNNCYWDASGKEITFSGKSLAEWQELGHDKNSIIADPGFSDIVGRDFTLADDSPALALGFTPIDISTAGLYGDAAWTDKAKQLKRIPAPPVAN
jgi:hypothetical protein